MALNVFSNGLRLVCTKKPSKKVSCVVLYIAGGTQSEKNFQCGISEYLTNMLFMGTKNHSTQLSLELYAKSHGIILTPHNSKESITISAVCPNEKIEKAIELLSEIAFSAEFTIESGDKVRRTQLSNVAMLAENPQFIMDRILNSTLYARTGLANPKHGTNISVSRFRALDAKDFLEKVFTPRNTIISVVGDINQDDVYEYTKKYFFDKMKEEESEYKKLKYVSHIDDFEGCAKGRNKRLNQTRVLITFPTVPFKDPKKHLLEILKPILIEHIKQSLANQIYYNDTKIKTKYYANNGHMSFEIIVDYEYAEDHLYNFVRSLNEDIKNREISNDEFETEKNVYLTNMVYKYDDVLELAISSAKNLALTKQTLSENAEKLKIEMLTCKEANKLLKEILDFKKMVIIYLGHDIKIDYDELISEL